MNAIDNLIPDNRRALITLLRCALKGSQQCPALSDASLHSLFQQAREQGVGTYMYPWLAAQKVFSETHPQAAEKPLAAWRDAFLRNLVRSDLIRQVLQPTLTRLTRAGIETIVLKGAWLGATVYDDPAQRTMSDIDLLVREADIEAAHRELTQVGFTADKDTLHNRFAYEQRYSHTGLPLPLELHWHVTSALTPAAPVPDIEAVWQNAVDSVWHNVPVKALPPADQLAHQAQHILHHLFAAPLRAYLDIALLLKKHGGGLSPSDLAESSARWRTGRALPFLLNMTSALLETPLPSQLAECCGGMRPSEAETAVTALFNLPAARDRAGESTLLDFREASSVGKLRLILRRVFMPRQFMTLYYPCARSRLGLPLAWFKRAARLYRRGRSLAAAAAEDSFSKHRHQDIARQRRQLTEKLLQQP
ncbi:MAG: nucleotidyltransferase family protein [Kiritimatiellae bacterium]|nr:nucleotidyltransferase family protein [Kiritimatiellia bacterium]